MGKERSEAENRKNSKEYKKIRENCLKEYKTMPKDNQVFDLCKVKKSDRLLLLEDEEYLMETAAIKAELYKKQLSVLDGVMNGAYADEIGHEKTPNILKAMQMKQDLLLHDVDTNNDLQNRLNIAFNKMDQEDFESLDTIEINEGTGNTDFSANFGVSSENMSMEEKAKAKLAEAQLEEKRKKEKEAEDD